MTERVGTDQERPWTVYVLLVLSLLGTAAGFIFDSDQKLWEVIVKVVSLLLAWGIWTGRTWAFTISFMLTSLCAGVTGVAALAQVYLFEGALNSSLLITFAVSAVWMVLLLLPETKRFAGLSREEVLPPRSDTGAPSSL